MSSLLAETLKIQDDIIKTRRLLHERPELSYQEYETAKVVAKKLRSLGIEVEEKVGGEGVVGLLVGNKTGKVVALRADMDALPLEEKADIDFKSKIEGIMHACGHDTHVAMLLGAAELLVAHKDELKGTVKFIFQPAEEAGGLGGAKPMIDAGVLKNPEVDVIFGLHIWETGLPSGVIGVRSGPLMASSDFFKIRIIGKGGHSSTPQETIDPIFISAQVITALQGVSSRMIDPIEPFVLAVCKIHSGTKDNIVPDEALLEGTMRTLDSFTRERGIRLVKDLTVSICKSFGASCEVNFLTDTNPVTFNDPEVTARAIKSLAEIPNSTTKEIKPILAGEDFSRFLELVPGMFYFLGTHNPAKGCIYPNHSSRFKVDEDVLKLGSTSLAKLALDFAAP